MHRPAVPTVLLLGTTICLGLACAADPGDSLKSTSGAAQSGSGGASGSGSNGASGSGTSSSSGVVGSSGANGSSSSGTGSGGIGSSSSGAGGGLGSSSSSGAAGSSSSGSGSSSGGATSSSGSGVADAGADAASSTCITNPRSATASYYTSDSATATAQQQIQFNVQVGNGGFSTITLSDVTLRYWFTNDGNAPATIMFKSYYSQNGNLTITNMVKATFAAAPAANVTPTSDTYLELSFATGTGTIGALGGGGANIQVEFNGAQNTTFNETNDYSFDATKTKTYQPWTHITAYVKGVLVYGCEPQSTTASSSGGAAGSSGAGADSGSAGSSGGDEAGSGG